MLSPGRGIRRASVAEMIRQPGAPGWKITATVGRQGQLHEIETWVEGANQRRLRLNGKTVSQLTLGQLVPMIWLVPAMDRLWLEGAEGRRRFVDRMTMSLFPDHAGAILTYEKSLRERNRLLRDGVWDDGWYRAIEARMAESGALISGKRMQALALLSKAQERTTGFPVATLSLVSRDDTVGALDRADLATALAEGRRRDMAAGRSLIGPHRADLRAVYAAKGVDARHCSTGEQKALLISLILANAHALSRKAGIAPIILLDEVAAHLDADRRAALYDEICALGAQTWLTGTDLNLFATLVGRARLVEISEKAGMSIIRERDL